MGYTSHLLWELHHQVALRYPKLGELIAYRNVFRQIPYDTAVDEASIEPLIIGQGFRLAYAPGAIVYNKGPETVRDFFLQRRRVNAGHLYVQDTLGYRVSTMSPAGGPGPLAMCQVRLALFPLAPCVVAMEACVRVLAAYDYRVRKRL